MNSVIWAIYSFFHRNAIKEILASRPLIGISSSIGTSIATFFIQINPILQFLGLCVGLLIAYLTAEAKLEERQRRKRLGRK